MHTARIVVAEDDPEMRALVADALRRDGHHVIELQDGARLLVEVSRQFRHHDRPERIDLVVSDVRMPIITGLAILKGLREAHSRLPVVLMTAFGDERTRSEAEKLGAVFLDKPFKIDDLRRVVRALLAAPAEEPFTTR